MAKAKTVFFCTNCGNETPKWMGRCPSCGAYNTMEEHVEKPVAAGKAKSAPVGMSRKPQRIREITSDGEIRFSTGMGELDRVLGGGAVAGSLVLVGGAPGIGKSTLLLQICSSLCVGRRVLYVSGEESERQLKLRAERLGVAPEELFILSETRLSDIVDAAEAMKPDILIVDSIQTLYNLIFGIIILISLDCHLEICVENIVLRAEKESDDCVSRYSVGISVDIIREHNRFAKN